MPIVVSREDITKRGGRYLPAKVVPIQPKPEQPTPAPLPTPAPDTAHMERMVSIMSAGQEVAADKLSQVIEILNRSGGVWDVAITERDDTGRIKRLSFTKTT